MNVLSTTISFSLVDLTHPQRPASTTPPLLKGSQHPPFFAGTLVSGFWWSYSNAMQGPPGHACRPLHYKSPAYTRPLQGKARDATAFPLSRYASPTKHIKESLFFVSSLGSNPPLHSLHNGGKPALSIMSTVAWIIASRVAFIRAILRISNKPNPHPMPRALPSRGPNFIQRLENMFKGGLKELLSHGAKPLGLAPVSIPTRGAQGRN